MTNTNRPIRRALVSVFHKEGIEVLAEAFVKAGTEVVSTGSTAKKLAELGVKVTEVSDVTGFPECLDGRVKTLHPYIHAGILADMTNPEHAKQLEEFGIKPFDLVVVNLYPFADTVRSGANEADTIEKIDIGGPSMVRGAAKNHATVAIVTDPADYALVASRVADGTGFSLDERKWLAAKAFAHTLQGVDGIGDIREHALLRALPRRVHIDPELLRLLDKRAADRCNKGLVQLLLDGLGTRIGHLGGNGVFLLIHVVRELGLLKVACEHARELFAEVLRNDDRGVVLTAVHALFRAFRIGEDPAQVVVFLELLDRLLTGIERPRQLIFNALVLVGDGDFHTGGVTVRIPVRLDVVPGVQ